MSEKWKPVRGYEGLYEVSREAEIRRCSHLRPEDMQRAKYLKQSLNNGRMSVQLCRDNKHIRRAVHIIVAEAFLDFPGEPYRVKHKDKNLLNNHADNLTWNASKTVAKRDSTQRRFIGLINRRAILALVSEGVSKSMLARAYGITESAISHMIERADKQRKRRRLA